MLEFKRRFTESNINVFDTVTWVKKDVTFMINNKEFVQRDVECPSFWSDLAIKIMVSKYFRGALNSAERESTVKQPIIRVAKTIMNWGLKEQYFDEVNANIFYDEIVYLLLNQYFSFNSPVWFNCFLKDALVQTINGMKEINKVEVGDLVLTHKGRYKPVSRIMKRTSLESGYTIKCRGNYNRAICTGEHPYEVFENGDPQRRIFKEASKVTLSDYIIAPYSNITNDLDKVLITETTGNYSYVVKDNKIIGTKATTDIESRTNTKGSVHVHPFKNSISNELSITSDLLYVIGYWLGDGCALKDSLNKGKGLVFSHAKDSPYMIKVNSIFQKLFNLTGVTYENGKNSWYTSFRSTVLARWFMYNFKGKEKIIPDWIMKLDPKKQLSLIHGLIDSDGTTRGGLLSVHISLSNKNLAWQIRELFLRNKFPIMFSCENYHRICPNGNRSKKYVYTLGLANKPFLQKLQKGSLKLEELGNIPSAICNENQWHNNVIIVDDSIAYRVSEIKISKFRKSRTFYNLSVKDDESYVVEGKSVHNCGIMDNPQMSACFILDYEDSMEGIANAMATESKIFKGGSGAGANISTLRSSYETLSKGGYSSGPISFMKGFDMNAGAIKSGGRTRRSSKMVAMNIWHPDILEQSDGKPGFIRVKSIEEQKAHALKGLGYDVSFGSDVLSNLQFQNANHSVRVDDNFMQAVMDNEEYDTREVTTNKTVKTYKAKQIFDEIVDATYICGDPGLQFHDKINEMHTCPHLGQIVSSNPCGEYSWIPFSACNLASIDLLKLLLKNNNFDLDTFTHIIELVITAQDIIVDGAGYPDERIRNNSVNQRPLGLGYLDVGGFLMCLGLPYDSAEGRDLISAITSFMTACAYNQSAKIANVKGPFVDYNKEYMKKVLNIHLDSNESIKDPSKYSLDIWNKATDYWDNVIDAEEFRNAQVTLIAPTGTISYLMDAVTTGIEPEYAIYKEKFLVGGGSFITVNAGVPRALDNLGYSSSDIEKIIDHIKTHKTIEGSLVRSDHLAVFDCADSGYGSRSIKPMGHVRMMAAVQPFVSGAISKTVNVPKDVTREEIADIYMKSWRMGLKSITVYRAGSKAAQPLSASEEENNKIYFWGQQKKLNKFVPAGMRHEFTIGNHRGYIHPGFYPDGSLAEIFISMDNGGGNTFGGLINCICIACSLALQHGCPPELFVKNFSKQTFEPMGFTDDNEIRTASNIMDYVFKRLMLAYGPDDLKDQIKQLYNKKSTAVKASNVAMTIETESGSKEVHIPGPICSNCGSITRRVGSCHVCPNCGNDTGCAG